MVILTADRFGTELNHMLMEDLSTSMRQVIASNHSWWSNHPSLSSSADVVRDLEHSDRVYRVYDV
jgi:hypothetical protein